MNTHTREPQTVPIITLNHLSKYFEGHAALDTINYAFKAGAITVILGASGAGKSTLLRTLHLLEKPTQGEVHLAQERIDFNDTKKLRKKREQMGSLFQHYHLLSQRCVLDNVALPLALQGVNKRKRNTTALHYLRQVNLASHAHAFPDTLSGGQQQRVAMARALVHKPSLLLCDEPTSALDPNAANHVLALLKQCNQAKNISIILITHQVRVAQAIADEVMVLDQGKLIEAGTARRVLTNPQHAITKKLLKADGVVLKTNVTSPKATEEAGSC